MAQNDHDPSLVTQRGKRPENPSPLKTVISAELFDGRREVIIAHRGETYCLRETRLGKLILTK